MSSTIVGLDIGTTKVTVVVGEILEDEQINIIGVGTALSAGMRKGNVVNIEEATHSIQKALDEAQKMADHAIDYVYVGVAGAHIQSISNEAGLDLDVNSTVSRMDVEKLLKLARDVVVPPNMEIVHSIVREFRLDSQDGIQDPVGMVGSRLEVSVHVVFGATNAIRNLVSCAHNLSLDVAEVILQPLASAEAVLTEDERNLGVVLVDIGGGTTDIAVFRDGKLDHTHVIPVGGWNFTNDLAVCLRTSDAEAERLKIRFGSVDPRMVEKSAAVEYSPVGSDDKVSIGANALVEILEPRGEELVKLVLNNVEQAIGDLKGCRAGIVITGGGAQIRGLEQMFRRMSGLQSVRVGKTRNVTGLVEKVASPIYATGVGLVLFGWRNHELAMLPHEEEGLLERFWTAVRSWLPGA